MDAFDLPDLGICQLNIDKAASLIAKCLWLNGEIETKLPKKEEGYGLYDKELDVALLKEIEYFKKLLIGAIKQNSLETTFVKFTITDEILSEDTYIDSSALHTWCNQRDIYLGDFYVSYMDSELEIMEKAVAAVSEARMTIEEGKIPDKESINNQNYISLMIENDRMRKELQELKQKTEELGSREKSSYLNIIGALLNLHLTEKNKLGIKYSSFEHQSDIIKAIHRLYGKSNGLSKTNLEIKFPKAKEALNEVMEQM
ncbi:MAG: hypothetical protein GY804_10135 [Alphaproteobacteria bacterium]|nr:hypothetical protein [Alphaproteobacteria bacterium]